MTIRITLRHPTLTHPHNPEHGFVVITVTDETVSADYDGGGYIATSPGRSETERKSTTARLLRKNLADGYQVVSGSEHLAWAGVEIPAINEQDTDK